jgi:DnaJ like chaperone protein
LFKFIGAIVGFFLLGRNFLAAFLGFLVGSFIDNFASVKVKGGSTEDVFNYYKQHSGAGSGDFANMLIALSAAVMRADGKVIKAELDYVKSFFLSTIWSKLFSSAFANLKALCQWRRNSFRTNL